MTVFSGVLLGKEGDVVSLGRKISAALSSPLMGSVSRVGVPDHGKYSTSSK